MFSRTRLKKANMWVVFQSCLKVQLVEGQIFFIWQAQLVRTDLRIILHEGSLQLSIHQFIHLLITQQDFLNLCLNTKPEVLGRRMRGIWINHEPWRIWLSERWYICQKLITMPYGYIISICSFILINSFIYSPIQ